MYEPLTSQQVCDFTNAIPVRQLATQFVDALPEALFSPLPGGGYGIAPNYVQPLAEALQGFVADVIAQVLDAGSERDAVMENDALRVVLEVELAGWAYPLHTHTEAV